MYFLVVREHTMLSGESWLRIVVPPSHNPSDLPVDDIFGASRCETIALAVQPNLLDYVVIARDTTIAMKVVIILHCCILLTKTMKKYCQELKDTTVYRTTIYLHSHSNSYYIIR